VWIST